MAGMGKSVVAKMGEREVICRELTVEAMRGLLARAPETDLVSMALYEDVQLGDLPAFTDLSAAEVGEAHPSELDKVMEGIREANPHFFAMLVRVTKAPRPA